MSERTLSRTEASFSPSKSQLPEKTSLLGHTPTLKNAFPSEKRLITHPPLSQAIQRVPCHKCRLPVQAKLTINKPGDRYEQEADRIADQVMRMPDFSHEHKAIPCERRRKMFQTTMLQRQTIPQVQKQAKCKDKEDLEEKKPIQLKADNRQVPETNAELQAHISTAKRGGQQLPGHIRTFFENKFEYDFSQVRVHSDENAARSAHSLNALAYTIGRDIVFGSRQYSPDTTAGRRLIAHELAHVIQQNQPTPGSNLIKEHSPNQFIHRYVSPLDILDYIGLAYDAGKHIYLSHFYEGTDRDFQLFLNYLYTAIDVVMAAIPGAGGVGLAARASHGIMVRAWNALPNSGKSKVIEKVSKSMGWTTAKAQQLINHELGAATVKITKTAILKSQTKTAVEAAVSATKPDNCFEERLDFIPCRQDPRDINVVAKKFLIDNEIHESNLGECKGDYSFGSNVIDACDGGPGQTWHCKVKGKPKDKVSVFGCFCYDEDGKTDKIWRRAHWSKGTRTGRRKFRR